MRQKILIFGANFPLAARIADLVRRDFDVITYDFSVVRQSGYAEVDTAFTGDLLSNTLTFHGARYVLLTSESLLYMHSAAMLSGLVGELQACKRIAGIHLSFIDIAEPIVVDSGRVIQVLNGDSAYSKRLAVLRESLTGLAVNVLQVQSAYSPENDLWGRNFLHMLFGAKGAKPLEVVEAPGDWEALSADEVAQTVVSRLGMVGTQRLSHGPYEGGLKAFCASATAAFVNWSGVQLARIPQVDGIERSALQQKTKPIHIGLHAVIRQAHCAVSYLYRKEPEDAFGSRTIGQFRFGLEGP